MSDESDWDHWLDEIAERGVNLTSWETDFVESIERLRKAGRTLTERQAQILERVWTERVS